MPKVTTVGELEVNATFRKPTGNVEYAVRDGIKLFGAKLEEDNVPFVVPEGKVLVQSAKGSAQPNVYSLLNADTKVLAYEAEDFPQATTVVIAAKAAEMPCDQNAHLLGQSLTGYQAVLLGTDRIVDVKPSDILGFKVNYREQGQSVTFFRKPI